MLIIMTYLLTKIYFSVKPAFFPADHLAGASVSVESIIGDGLKGKMGKQRNVVSSAPSSNDGLLYCGYDLLTIIALITRKLLVIQ
jgi:hypothetical protein